MTTIRGASRFLDKFGPSKKTLFDGLVEASVCLADHRQQTVSFSQMLIVRVVLLGEGAGGC